MKGEKVFFDTNVLIYAFVDDPRTEIAEALLREGGIVGVQNLNEFAATAYRKLRMSWPKVLEALRDIRVFCRHIEPLTIETHEAALKIAERYRYHIYDALVIAAAQQASCSTLYSEDMNSGQAIDGLTIRNPF
jgi:predicted nucleic acid-binding protein